MADVVQHRLEGMVPELHYCLKRKLLNRAEVSALVRQRRSFEYRLQRRTVTKLDYLRYIRSELQVEELLRLREGASASGKTSKARYGTLRRVVRLLWALIARWGFQSSTARTALQIAAALPNRKLLARLYGRLLQLHVHDVQLWSEAATYEFTANGNVRSARALFQRALRLNQTSAELWTAYLRLETMHWQLVHDSRTTDAPAPITGRAAVEEFGKLLESLRKGSDGVSDESDAVAASAEAGFLELAVPQRVAAEALRQCASPALVRHLVQVYADFGLHAVPAALALLRQSTRSLTTADEDTRAAWIGVLAEAPLLLQLGADAAAGVDLCANTFEAAVARFGLSGSLLSVQLHTYRTVAEAHARPLGGVPRVLYQKLFAQCAALDAAQLSPEFVMEWLAFARSGAVPADGLAVARAVCSAAGTNGTLWCAALQVLAGGGGGGGETPERLAQLLNTALTSSLPSVELAAFSVEVLASGLASAPPSPERLLAALLPHLSKKQDPCVVRSLLSFLLLNYNLHTARRAVEVLTQRRRQSVEVVLACVAIEAPADQRRATLLEQALANTHSSQAAPLWAALVHHHLAAHDASAAQSATWRARRSLRGAQLASFERAIAVDDRKEKK